MPTTLIEFRATFIDPERESSTISMWQEVDVTSTLTEVEALRDAWCAVVTPLTNATQQECSFTDRQFSSLTVPNQTVYGNAEDKLYAEFRSVNNGALYTTQIPGPKTTDFAADDETINPADTNVLAFIAYVEANGVTKQGIGGLKFILGYRRRSKSRKERPGIPTARG